MKHGQDDAHVRVTREGMEGTPQWKRGFGEIFTRWQAAPGHLSLEACHTGFVPGFWYADRDQIIASTSMDHFKTAIRLEPDEEALAIFGRLGFFIGNRTPFKGLSVVGPSQKIEWRDGKLSITGERLRPAPFTGSYTDALNIYVELFRASVAAIAETISENFIISLTGGRDSRHIAIELHRLGIRPRFALTTRLFPIRPDLDWPIARKICDRFGWEHRVVSPPRDWYAMDRWCVERTSFMSHEHGWLQGAVEAIGDSGVDFAFDGVGGDVLSAGLYQSCQTPEKVLAKWHGGGLGVLALPDFGELLGSDEAAVALVAEEFDDPKSFHFWNRTRRNASLLPFRMIDCAGLAPYVSREVMEFLLSLPLDFTSDGTFHDKAIALAAPDLDIPYSDESRQRPKLPLVPPRAYAARLLFSDGRYKAQYLKAIIRGWASIAGYLPRGLVYMDMIEEQTGQRLAPEVPTDRTSWEPPGR